MSDLKKVWRRLQAIAQVRDGAFFAAELYPQIRDDCLRVFYTSRVSLDLARIRRTPDG